MFGLLRARGFAAALTALAAMFAAPATAAAAEAGQLAAPALNPAVLMLPAIQAPQSQPQAAQPVPPLKNMVIAFVDYRDQDAEQLCLAKAVYFEARGETLEGQLAVAEVILNRTASGVYPSTICGVVTQPAQFSFIRGGKFPTVDTSSDCWHKALAVADIARKRLIQAVAPNVLWYHATYVAPSWGGRLTRVTQIGTHIFYAQA